MDVSRLLFRSPGLPFRRPRPFRGRRAQSVEQGMSTASEYAGITGDEMRRRRQEKLFTRINRTATYLNVVGFGWLGPLLKIAAGGQPSPPPRELRQQPNRKRGGQRKSGAV